MKIIEIFIPLKNVLSYTCDKYKFFECSREMMNKFKFTRYPEERNASSTRFPQEVVQLKRN